MLRAPSTVLFLSWAVLLSLLLASVSAEDEDLLTERAPPLNLQTPHQRMYVPFMHPIQQRTFEFMPHTVDVCRLVYGDVEGMRDTLPCFSAPPTFLTAVHVLPC